MPNKEGRGYKIMNLALRTTFRLCSLFLMVLTLAFSTGLSLAERKKPAMHPALVEVQPIKEMKIKPNAIYTGTVHFKDISDIASEVEGKVEEIFFDEGFRVKKDAPLLVLNSDILKKELLYAKSRWQTARLELAKAKIDFARIEKLYKKEGASKQLYDDLLYKTKILDSKARGLKIEYEKLKVELEKKTIRSPYNAVVMKRPVDTGEWVSKGSTCARLGRLSSTEVIVHVPSEYLKFNSVGDPIPLSVPSVSKALITGEIYSVIPSGDISTRTFPVKISIKNDRGLYLDGMEAKVYVATGEPGKYLAVSRDALILVEGTNFIYIVKNGIAQIVPVKIKAYTEQEVAVVGPGLKSGLPAVVRGNERLRPGQPVKILKRH